MAEIAGPWPECKVPIRPDPVGEPLRFRHCGTPARFLASHRTADESRLVCDEHVKVYRKTPYVDVYDVTPVAGVRE